MGTRGILHGVSCTLVVFVTTLALCTCEGGHHRSHPGLPGVVALDAARQAPVVLALDEVLAEIESHEAPEGVESTLYERLRDELARQLRLRAVGKIVCAPPTSEANRVNDLSVTDNGDGHYTLIWHYRNQGDYDQNGTVAIADITPIAMHFSEEVPEGDTQGNSLQAVIDSSGNGKVDIADVTAIAMSFGRECTAYAIERSLEEDGTYVEVATVPLSQASGEGRLAFSYGLYLTPGWVRVIPCDGAAAHGIASDPVRIPIAANQPPVAQLAADPEEGDMPLSVNFDASGSYDPDGSIETYDYDWEGDGSYELLDGGATPTHLYESAGEYNPTVRVKDDDSAESTASVAVAVWLGRGDWWMFGREPTHNHRSPYVGPQTNNVKWAYNTGAGIISSPVIGVDGTVYVGSGNALYAITSEGNLAWTYPTGGLVNAGPAIGRDGTVYAPCFDAYLYAIAPDGNLDWRYEMDMMAFSSPAIAEDGTIYVGNLDGNLYAINPDGSLKWRYETGGEVDSCPAIGPDGTVYVGSTDNYVYAIHADGSLSWRYKTGYLVYSSPAVYGGDTILVGSMDNKVYSLGTDGSFNWDYATGDPVNSGPAVGEDGTVYVGSTDNKLHALTPQGGFLWAFEAADRVDSSPAVGGDGTIYFGSYDGKAYAVNPDGSLLWEYPTGNKVSSSPAIAEDGTLYIGSWDGFLYAFRDDGITPPSASISADPTEGIAPLQVHFDGSGSTDDGTIVQYEWDWDGEANGWTWYDSGTDPLADHVYGEAGAYEAVLRVTDDDGATDTDSVLIEVSPNGWIVSVVDDTVGNDPLSSEVYNSLVEVDGRPGIAYYHVEDKQLKFALCSTADGTGDWDIQLVDGDADVGEYCSLAIINDLPAISYYDAYPNCDLKFAINSEPDASGIWAVQTVETEGYPGTPSSLAEVVGKPAMGYLDMPADEVSFARNSVSDGSGTWSFSVVDSFWSCQMRRCQMAVIAGKPGVVYFHGFDMQLKYAYSSLADGSGTWAIHVVHDVGTQIGYRLTLAEIDGRPAVAYRYVYGDPQQLCFAICSTADGSGAWTISVVDSSPSSFDYPSLKVVDGYPTIAYSGQDGFLLYAVNTMADASGGWVITPIAHSEGAVSVTNLAVIDGSPAVSYHDSGPSILGPEDDSLRYVYKAS
jgi:outer membrane protein assembly factor BamB